MQTFNKGQNSFQVLQIEFSIGIKGKYL